MKKHLFLPSQLALLLGAAVVVAAQTEHVTPFTGIWKLNLAKSQFDPGPPFKSFTIAFTPDGTRHLDLIEANGQPIKVSLPWSGGKEVHPTGMENAMTISKIQGKTFHDIWKQNGTVTENVHGVLSSNGKTLTTTVDGTTPQGRAYHNHLTFEKQ